MRIDDPIERLAAADPLPEAERLTEADQRESDALLARILATQPQRAPRRHARRWVLAVGVGACALVLAVSLVDVLDEDAPGPGVVERAVAAVSEPNSIYHTIEVLRFNAIDGQPSQSGYLEGWYGPNHRTHRKAYDFRHGRRGRLRSEEVSRLWPKRNGRFAGRGVMYDPARDRIIHVRVGRTSNDRIPFFDPNGDPAAGMRKLERDGRLRLVGSERFDGKRVYRLTSGPFRFGGLRHRIEYLVDARSYYPVFMRWVGLSKGERVLAETRYLTYERLPFDAEHRELLRMDPHPGAKVIPLPQP
jgi:hypothetical protein